MMPETRKDREIRVISKALEDAGFRAGLLSGDAKTLIEEAAGIKFPDKMRIEVVEEQPGTVVFVLPRDVSNEIRLEGTLSDEDLENVAGGKNDTYNCSGATGGHNTHIVHR
ncbi:MAG: NHLP leader peptide family natural product precursor [Deltaproteobacteria bacterium]|nr:MAG: NHLP leader peptide family natural product precursor [Deltaproteobacteria bacterium]